MTPTKTLKAVLVKNAQQSRFTMASGPVKPKGKGIGALAAGGLNALGNALGSAGRFAKNNPGATAAGASAAAGAYGASKLMDSAPETPTAPAADTTGGTASQAAQQLQLRNRMLGGNP